MSVNKYPRQPATESRKVILNTDLAKKPPECLEYIVVHEMAHLSESTHSAPFIALMDQLMPSWRHRRDQLHQLPVRHENWGYRGARRLLHCWLEL
jgi:predicted metal-dependent hydrolase